MAKAKKTEMPAPVMQAAIKGFDANLSCRGFKYETGRTYTHEGVVKACRAGFHSISGHPLAVFEYYPPAGSRFCLVEVGGATDSDDGVKVASEILIVGREIGITDLVNEALKWVLDRSHPEGEAATGDQGAASATGDQGAASATGYRGAASATGDQGAASATGYQGAASATGDRGAASATGYLGRVSGTAGNALFAVERETWDGPIVSAACGIAGQDGIEPNVWYTAKGGKLVVA